MATLNPYIEFDGDCEKAMSFYQACLGGELKIMKIGQTPMAASMPKEAQDKVMHAHLSSKRMTIMGSDRIGPDKVKRGDGMHIMLYCESEAEIRELFPKLSVGGSVQTPLKEQFWGAVYGDFTDKFGVHWMMNWDKPA